MKLVLISFALVGLLAQASRAFGAPCAPAECEWRERMDRIRGFYTEDEYDRVLNELAIVQGDYRQEEKFFAGMSYFGLMGQTRSKALQCSYRQSARIVLKNYLTGARKNFQQLGTYGSDTEIRQTYTATRVISELDKVRGCLENALTQADIELLAEQHSRDVLERIQLSLAIPDKATSEDLALYAQGKETWKTIQGLTRQFVAKASHIETEIAKKYVEYEAARFNIEQLKTELNNFGSMIDSANGPAFVLSRDSSLASVQKRVADAHKMIDDPEGRNGFKQQFEKALGDLTPEKYSAIQKVKFVQAAEMVSQLSFASYEVKDLVADSNSPVRQASRMAGGNAAATATAIKKAWQDYGVTRCAAMTIKAWYCQR